MQRKYIVVVLAAVVVGLVVFVGACGFVDQINQSRESTIHDDWQPVGEVPPFLPVWSLDDTKILLSWWGGSYLVEVGPDSGNPKPIVIEGDREAIYPRMSPDESQIAFLILLLEDGFELGVSNIDGSEYKSLTRSRGTLRSPEWSPDGTRIAFVSNYYGPKGSYFESYGLYLSEASGAGPRKIVDVARITGPPSWSPDGRRIAFLARGGIQPGDWPNTNNVYIVDSHGSNLTMLAKASSPPVWSPDGSHIAFLRGGDRDSLFVIKPDGSGMRKLADSIQRRNWTPDARLSWSPDGSEILLQEYPFVRIKVDEPNYPEGRAPYAVYKGPEGWEVAYASWSSDASRIAVTIGDFYQSLHNAGDPILLIMSRDGSDQRVLARVGESLVPHAVPNEPWEGEGEWVWHSP